MNWDGMKRIKEMRRGIEKFLLIIVNMVKTFLFVIIYYIIIYLFVNNMIKIFLTFIIYYIIICLL